jgi:hypothetical protein
VAGWGYWFGLLGLVVSIVGFGFTIYQLMLTRSAAQAAVIASEQAKKRVASYDMIFELSRASSALEATHGHIRRGDWPEVLQGYSEARLALVRISQFPSALSDDSKRQVGLVSEQIERSCRRVGVNMTKGADQSELVRALQANTDYQVAVTKIHAGLDRITTNG